MIKKNVLVIGCDVGGYGVIRALGEKGIYPIALTYDDVDFAYSSKYVSEKVKCPHPSKEQDKFIDFLISNRHRWDGHLILETDDDGVVAISKFKNELNNNFKIATEEWEILKNFIEKKETLKISLKSNVPHPQNFLPYKIADLEKIKNELSYPCLLKPVQSHEFKLRLGEKNFVVNNENELNKKFRLCMDAKVEVMVQEIISGPETNLYKMQAYINSKGELTSKFFFIKMRQHPPHFGVGRVCVSTKKNREVEFLSERLVSAANYKGLCSVEFKKDPRDDILKLMEVNVRMPRNSLLATSSGVNFPWIIYNDLVEDKQIDVRNYKTEFYWIELYRDIYNIIFRSKKEKISFRDYIRPYLSNNKSFAVLTTSDIIPFFKQTSVLISKTWNFLFNKIFWSN